MKCMYCGCEDSKVIDSRSTEDGKSIRRRRECINCGKRFTTFETIEIVPFLVVKRDGTRQSYDRTKLKKGILRSCEKRPISMAQIDQIVESVEKQLYNSLEQEITSSKIGDLVMEELKPLDEVAYIRFAAVYRQFKDSATFFEEMSRIFGQPPKGKKKK
ncbi:MAG: transcriptional repressor NrdR [Clostridia bacterium]|nr:transcriptional repressor NrdR [Clostridia bacterium]MBQ7915100.1 transcriptional repressor NrdR [Clostridia bacterium]MBQ8504838.1 transcriptional repressor NrdR [Clostridia bacterium]MBQ8772664.1 transcriptional repressor NrdR [Clostridia bacterium]MBQ8872431.1 transcriptional repressor NrdR [Clostridia bacterium]